METNEDLNQRIEAQEQTIKELQGRLAELEGTSKMLLVKPEKFDMDLTECCSRPEQDQEDEL